MNPTRRRSLWRRGAALGVTAVVSSCGAPVDPVNPIADSSAATSQPAVASNETAPRATTTVPTASISPSPVTAVSSTTTGPSEQLIDEIEGLLDAAMAPGAIAWDCCGADAPPTGAVAAVRRPGEPDVVVTWGTSVDGTAYDGAAPFNVAGLTSSLVATLGFQLVDDGTLDPAATIERWLSPAGGSANGVFSKAPFNPPTSKSSAASRRSSTTAGS